MSLTASAWMVWLGSASVWNARWWTALGETLLHSLWLVAAVAAVVRLALWWTRTPRARHALALAGLVTCLVTVSATFVLRWAEAPSTARSLDPRAESALSDVSPIGPTNAEPRDPSSAWRPDLPAFPTAHSSHDPVAAGDAGDGANPAEPSVSTPSTIAFWIRRSLPYGVALWFCGLCAAALRPLCGALVVRRLRSRCQPAPERWTRRLAQLVATTRTSAPVALFVGEHVRGPMLVGWLRPAILVPAAALHGLSPAQLETVLLHELAHLRRFDPLLRTLQTMVETLLYYHPAVWWMSRVVREERERCCDDLVVEQVEDRSVYARALLRLQELATPNERLALAATGGSLRTRIERIVGVESTSPRVRPAWSPGVVVLCVLLAAIASVPRIGAQDEPGSLEVAQTSLERQRAQNLDAYRLFGERLRESQRGQWTVIVDGDISGPFATFDTAVAAADTKNPSALHRFIYRPGVDDHDAEEVLSPWLTGDPNWTQFGRRFHAEQGLTVSAHTWVREGRQLATPDGRGTATLFAPDGKSESARISAVVSGMFQQELTIPASLGERLGLERFAVPARVRVNQIESWGFAAHARVVIEELGIDARVVAFLIPNEVVATDVAGEPEPGTDRDEASEPDRWTVHGRVTDTNGVPVEGAEVRVHCGIGTLRCTGSAHSDDFGLYSVEFGPGMWSMEDGSVGSAPPQAATVSVSRSGFVERDLGRHGDRRMANRSMLPPGAHLDGNGRPVLVEGAPARIDFVLEPAAKISGVLVDPNGEPLSRIAVSLTGDELPPSSNVLAATTTDFGGRFQFDAVPGTKTWRLRARVPGSWQTCESAPLEMGDEITHHRIVARFNLASDPPTVRCEAWNAGWDDRFGADETPLSPIRGAVTPDPTGIAWGKAVRGLRAGVVIELADETCSAGDLLPVSFHVQNVGDEVIRFESSTLRCYDTLMIRPETANFVDVDPAKPPARVDVECFELHPAESVVLKCAPIRLQTREDAKRTEADAQSYACHLPAGPALLYFRLRFPDTHRNGAFQGHFGGGLYTGEVHFQVNDG